MQKLLLKNFFFNIIINTRGLSVKRRNTIPLLFIFEKKPPLNEKKKKRQHSFFHYVYYLR